MNKIPVSILKHNIFPFFKNEITCCTDRTLYNLIFVNKFFKKIVSYNTLKKKVYKLIFLNNVHVCTKCNNFNLNPVIYYYKYINNKENYPDVDITTNFHDFLGFIHFSSNKEFNNFEIFLLKNNITELLLISKCCGGLGGKFRYIKN